ncbi:hypothetical protein KUH03_26010 [Sphingobacterium sp. E70]|uniref:hypothetical protein n=1 Tax=Sphingobacterium sp. E70 TaxID=2853439 RepID=UPI00211C62A8|nr:hypothetical protein [Sphingobacterium sp. E70]ULT22755.1 hypothetical protein KUH03_26010 [Sphingobacterium sp. E70]
MKFVAPNKLENDKVVLKLIDPSDFDTLYQVAKDPLIWEQHPNKDRWKEEVFRSFLMLHWKAKQLILFWIKRLGNVSEAPGIMV